MKMMEEMSIVATELKLKVSIFLSTNPISIKKEMKLAKINLKENKRSKVPMTSSKAEFVEFKKKRHITKSITNMKAWSII